MESVSTKTLQLERILKGILRGIDLESLSREEEERVATLKRAIRAIKLDVRDYEYAMTRTEQVKWAKIATHNLKALDQTLLAMGEHIGPADMAELGALIDAISDGLK